MDSNTFTAGLDFLCLAMASDLARHYTFALESFGKNEFLDENSQLDKKSLIAALSTMVFMQNISSSRTQKTFLCMLIYPCAKQSLPSPANAQKILK